MDIITNRLLRQAVPLFNTMAGVVLVLGIAAILMLGKDVIVYLALSVLLSFALTPIAVWLERIGLGRGLAVLGAIVLALTVIVGISYVTYQQVSALVDDIPSYESTIRQKISGLTQKMAGTNIFGEAADSLARAMTDLEKIAGEGQKVTAAPAVQTVHIDNKPHGFEAIAQYLGPVLKPVASLLVVLLLAAFMLAQREDLRNRLIRLAGEEDIQQTTAAFDDAGFRVGRQLLMQLAVNISL